MGLSSSQRSKRKQQRPAGLAGLRREINNRVVNMILAQLSEEQQELLGHTAGNPAIQFKLEQLVLKLMKADRVIDKARTRRKHEV